MGDSHMLVLPQGFYVRTKDGTIYPALTIPGEHVIGSKWRILTSDFGYKSKSERWYWALRGMPYDGETSCFRDSNRIAPATIHDHGCYESDALPVGEARNALRAEYDALYREMLEFIECRRFTVAVFPAAVRGGSLLSRWAKPEPSYATDLERAYAIRGIKQCLPMVFAWQASA
jgi:hypothetical protein